MLAGEACCETSEVFETVGPRDAHRRHSSPGSACRYRDSRGPGAPRCARAEDRPRAAECARAACRSGCPLPCAARARSTAASTCAAPSTYSRASTSPVAGLRLTNVASSGCARAPVRHAVRQDVLREPLGDESGEQRTRAAAVGFLPFRERRSQPDTIDHCRDHGRETPRLIRSDELLSE